MYAMKRPSAGRGEYEIAEEHNGINPHDLVEHNLVLDCHPYEQRPTGIRLIEQGGKLRLRIAGEPGVIHLHRQVQALLMLPKPIRDETRLAGGRPVVMENRYVLRKLNFGEVTLENSDVVVRLSSLEADNYSGDIEELDVVDRISRIKRLHELAESYPDPIRDELDAHRAVFESDEPLTQSAETLVRDLMESVAANAPDYGLDYVSGTDVLEALESILQLPELEKPPSIEDIPPDEVQIRRREAARWRRWAAARGVSSAKFRRRVREAYDSTCIVCGLRLPKSEFCEVPGVDAAHILPWAQYDLDVTANGLCLCKLHHWAFDQQLIAIAESGGSYEVFVTERARQALQDDSESLEELERVAGPIPDGRLPSQTTDRPRPEFLAHLYQDVPLEVS